MIQEYVINMNVTDFSWNYNNLNHAKRRIGKNLRKISPRSISKFTTTKQFTKSPSLIDITLTNVTIVWIIARN